MLKRPTVWLVAVLLLTLFDAVYWGYARFRIEYANRTVEIAVDMTQLSELARARGLKLSAVLGECKQAGVTSVALSELTLADLENAGRVQVYPRDLALQAYPHQAKALADYDFVVAAADPNLLSEISRTLAKKCPQPPALLYREGVPGAKAEPLLGVHGGAEVLETLGVCFDPDQVRLAHRNGFAIICRYLNYPGLTADGIRYLAALAQRKEAHLLIFAEEEVLGYEDLLPETAEALKASGLVFGQVEFGKQRGDAHLAKLMFPYLIRVHSIGEKEQLKLTPDVAARRFVRAARERNIRVCYLRFFPQPKAGAVDTNIAYVKSVVRGLHAAGLKTGVARPLPPFRVPAEHRAVAAAGVAAGFVLLICTVAGMNLLPALGLWLTLAVCAAGVILLSPTAGAKLTALGAGLTFPSLALTMPAVATIKRDKPPPRHVVIATLQTLPAVCAVTLAGAAFAVCLLGETRFMLKLDQFSGIKLAHLLPVLFVAGCYMGEIVPAADRDWSTRWQNAKARFRAMGEEPVRYYQAAIAVVALVLAGFILLRTGNTPGVGVSAPELRIREWLEAVLVARPRFKEFALGHPALVLAVGCALRGWRGAVTPLLVLAAFGQVSLFNTFCHVHTPLWLSLLRAANGAWLGWGLGLAALGVAGVLWHPGHPNQACTPRQKPC